MVRLDNFERRLIRWKIPPSDSS